MDVNDYEFVICGCCGYWMANGGDDIACDECGMCDWLPADEEGNLIPEGG